MLNKNVNYYESLTTGELSKWFKKVYPENRALWLSNNYDKIPFLHDLNNFAVKDQTFVHLVSKIQVEPNIDSQSKKVLDAIFREAYKNNYNDFILFLQELGYYPSAKSLCLIQTPFFLVQTHALKIPELSMRYLPKVYPYWEESYLSGDIDIWFLGILIFNC